MVRTVAQHIGRLRCQRKDEMVTIDEDSLRSMITNGISLELIEPQIYSVLRDIEIANPYDTKFGFIYDWVACNPLYNRLIWGYSISNFASLTHDALSSTKQGCVLDVGCGSLAFTAETYVQYCKRPVVLLDQSLRMLRVAKTRLIKLNGKVPDNLVFLRTDALRLPFQPGIFDTIISQNLLHCLDDTKKLLAGLRNVLSKNGRMYFTTLVKGNRMADGYLKTLAGRGKLVFRGVEEHQTIFAQLGMPIKYAIKGNMAFIYCK
jgi:SAM-dependent methyltransferase